LLAVEAADEGDIRSRFAADPWAAMGLLRIGSIELWTIWLDGWHEEGNPSRARPAG